MPETLSLSTGVSLGLLAGIVSGVCYLMANGVNQPKDDDSTKDRSIASSSKRRFCFRCGGDIEGGILPCVCHHHKPAKFESGAWFLRQVQRALSLMPWSISTDKLEQIEEECEPSPGPSDVSRGELHSIREFLELLSAKLAGGPLERTRVAPLYDHPTYLPPPHHASSVSSNASGASGAHAQLKRLVARVVEEASALPALARYASEPSPTPTIESSTYEDLLATAILNKVIERYQTENGSGGRSSGIHSASASPSPSDRSSPRSLNSRNIREISPPLREEDDVSDWEEGEATDEAQELPRRVPFPEFGGDIVHHDNEDRDFDEISSSDIQAVDGSWEENWLFQKKKIKNSQSVPVPMLVPNSNTEYRALIGDRDVEDTSDLSDNASDAEEVASEFKSDMKNVLDSKHIIGGKPKIEDVLTDDCEPDSLMIIDGSDDFEKFNGEYQENKTIVDTANVEVNKNVTANNKEDNTEKGKDSVLILGMDSGPPLKAEFNLNEEIHRTIFNGNRNGQLIDFDRPRSMAEDSLDEVDYVSNMISYSDNTGSMNTLSRHERVGEYEETVSIPVQRYADSLRRKHFDYEAKEYTATVADKEEDLIPGSIAYRERKKWLNYVEMPNNPYSPEAIQRRLSAKSTSSLFDTLTSKSNDFDTEIPVMLTHKSSKEKELETVEKKENGIIIEKEDHQMYKVNLDANEIDTTNIRDKSTSPKISEEVPQYKRYGRDYYIKEAKTSSGARKTYSFSDTSSISSMHKSTSLDNFDTEFTSPVSASSSLSDLEASALHHNIVRAFLSPRNASPNFAINPIFENPDRQNDNADEYHATDRHNVSRNGLLIKQFTTIATNQQYTKFTGKDEIQSSITTKPNNNDDVLIEYEDANEQTLFAAKPAFADDDTDRKFEEILHTAYNKDASPLTIQVDKQNEESEKSPNNLSTENSFVSSSSFEDSIKIYNVQTGEIVKCKPEDKVSPRYDEATDSNDNIDILDKNLPGETAEMLSSNDVNDETVTINDIPKEDSLYKISEIGEILPQLPKVKELAKKFVSMENLNEPIKPPQQYLRRRKSKENMLNPDNKTDKPVNKLVYMHSLTARSISKEFRDELKLSMATPLTIPGGSKDFPEGIEEITKESSRPGSPHPEPGTLKTKLAFFERLKSKFSNN